MESLVWDCRFGPMRGLATAGSDQLEAWKLPALTNEEPPPPPQSRLGCTPKQNILYAMLVQIFLSLSNSELKLSPRKVPCILTQLPAEL